MEWLEVHGKTVELAVKVAMEELGVDSPDAVEVEVLQQGKSGFLGLGSQEAIVKVTPRKPKSPRRRRRRGKGGSGGDAEGRGNGQKERSPRGGKSGASTKTQGQGAAGDRPGRSAERSHRNEGKSREGQRDGRGEGRRRDGQQREKAGQDDQRQNQRQNRQRQNQRDDQRRGQGQQDQRKEKKPVGDEGSSEERRPEERADINEQATVASDFLVGLLEAFGLEGDVTTRIDEEVLYIDVAGEQTEALVGPRGVILQSVLELTRTVVQRKTFGAPRMRLDISGYTERRRTALTIYAGKLAEKILDNGGEVMLEPMNPADRKVVHDAIGEIDGVESYSEGEDPRRAVVISIEAGLAPRKGAGDDVDSDVESSGDTDPDQERTGESDESADAKADDIDGSSADDDDASDTDRTDDSPDTDTDESDEPDDRDADDRDPDDSGADDGDPDDGDPDDGDPDDSDADDEASSDDHEDSDDT